MKKPLLEKFIIPLFIFVLFVTGISLVGEPAGTDERGVKISFLNVGQGDSTLIKTENNNYILIDGGPDRKVLEEMGKEMPFNKRDIEAIIVSHPHADHVAGLNYVLDHYNVKKVYLTGVLHTAPDYVEFLNKVKENGIQAEKLYAPKEFEIDRLNFKAHWPKEDLAGVQVKDQNENSIVLTATYGQKKVLLLGDLPDKHQDLIAHEFSRVDIMKVAHQGAKDGVSKKMLEATRPEYAVISVGENSYGHPTEKAINLLSAQKIRRTDFLGAIRFFLTENAINPL